MEDDYELPILTVDVALFAIINGRLHVLITKRDRDPYEGRLALPGGYIHTKEDIDTLDAAHRVVRDKLGIEVAYMEQLREFSGPDRDPRGWSCSIVYLGMVKPEQLPGALVQGFRAINPEDKRNWSGMPSLAFDHNKIINHAVQRVRSKASYSSLPLFVMPPRFSLGELQQVYEAMMGIKLDKSGFRRRIVEQEIVEPTDKRQDKAMVSHRPAQLYRASVRSLRLFERDMGK